MCLPMCVCVCISVVSILYRLISLQEYGHFVHYTRSVLAISAHYTLIRLSYIVQECINEQVQVCAIDNNEGVTS